MITAPPRAAVHLSLRMGNPSYSTSDLPALTMSLWRAVVLHRPSGMARKQPPPGTEGRMVAGHVPVTFGSTRSRRTEVDGFLVSWVRFPPVTTLPLHTHERATVAVILNGS